MCPIACKAHISSTSPEPIDKITVGAAIIRLDGSVPRVLLLKRIDQEKYHPGMFELPGGKVEETDETIFQTVIREVIEETLLIVLEVIAPLQPIRYITEKKVADATGCEFPLRRRTVQLNYIVRVKDNSTNFFPNPEEHSAGVWAGVQDLKELPMTEEMRSLVLEALEFFQAPRN